MLLRELLAGVDVLELSALPETEILSVCYDSRKACKGCLFVAVTGFATDGHRFIGKALEAGAAAVICERVPEEKSPYVLVSSSREALARIGANYYSHPSDSMTVIGVTGTNGKTSSTMILKSVLETTLGAKVGLIGTIQNMIGDEIIPTERTTPESFELQALFARMRDAGCTHVVMEVSSHALVLNRVAGISFDVGAFTNLTEDHLDFHNTMEAYAEAKSILFRNCRIGCINVDDEWAPEMMKNAACRLITSSAKNRNADLYCSDVELYPDSVTLTLNNGGESCIARIGIPGDFTVYNVLTVISCVLAIGIPLQSACNALAGASGVKGRIEVVPVPGKKFTVLIDYAHTPDALEKVLRSCRGFCKGRLISVFGCGGDRDPLKRPIMGEIGAKLSDYAVITSDNPRTEEPMAIIDSILEGVRKTDTPYTVEENRRKAIRIALDYAKANDVVVLAGKGHETYQERDKVKYHLDEREEVAGWLKETACS